MLKIYVRIIYVGTNYKNLLKDKSCYKIKYKCYSCDGDAVTDSESADLIGIAADRSTDIQGVSSEHTDFFTGDACSGDGSDTECG